MASVLLFRRGATAQDLLAEANAAYQARDFARCGDLRARALGQRRSPGIAFGAGICFALAHDVTQAFELLDKAIALGFDDIGTLQTLPALEGIRSDSRWKPLLERVRERHEANLSSDDPRLRELSEADQADRSVQPIDWTVVARKDAERRKEVIERFRAAQVRTGNDYFRAALILQHGETAVDYYAAWGLALEAVRRGTSEPSARWLVAATYDRFLWAVGRPQRFGTQFQRAEGRWTVDPIDTSVCDEERAEWNVPPLESALARVREMNGRETAK